MPRRSYFVRKRAKPALRQAGISIGELIFFIVIAGIAAAAVLGSFRAALYRTPTPTQMTIATRIAQQRAELILAQKPVLGFTSTALDPCPIAGVCAASGTANSPVNGYTVTVSGANALVACPAAIDPSTSNCRSISVTVTGPSASQLAQLTTIVTNH